MASDNETGSDQDGRPRRSSFVPPAEANEDFVPVLPAVGSTPIPPADAVNYFPTVATGQPSLREPEAPARLVVPSRQSMTEEEIARSFAESGEMSSVEQITLLDAQMTLREADSRTAHDFVATLRNVHPAEAGPLLDELKARFFDVDPDIAALTLGEVSSWQEPVVETTPSVDEPIAVDAPVVEIPEVSVASAEIDDTATTESVDTAAADADNERESSLTETPGRYRGWAAVIALATVVAALVPLTSSVFTVFGAPAADLVESLLGQSGVFVLLIALVTTVPLTLLARATASRNGLTWRSALQSVTGTVGGSVLAVLGSLAMLVGFVVVLLVTSQGVGLQLASIPGVASTIAAVAPTAHLTVLVVSAVIAIGFVIATLPRRVFRAIILWLAGFVAVGPAVVLLTDIAVIGNSVSELVVSVDTVVIAMGVVPIAVVVLAAVETGAATVVRRDHARLHGLWLYLGLVAGIAFAGWVLLSGMVGDVAGSVFVGSNPALHVVAASNELAFVIGSITFGVPLVFLSALVGRTLAMMTVRGDVDAPNMALRLLVVLIPVTIFALDALGLVPDLGVVLPGAAFLSIPLMAVVGLMAGASIASRRTLASWAKVTNAVLVSLFVIAGFALTLWAVPGLEAFYTELIAPVAATVGLTGATALVVPAGVLIVTFFTSLLVSTFGARRSTSTK